MDMKANTPVHRLRGILKEHEATIRAEYAAHHSRMFINGLASVLTALRRNVRCTVIEELFANCGIYPYCPNVILANRTAKISADESTKVLCVIPDLAKILLRKGEISTVDFDKIGIRKMRILARIIMILSRLMSKYSRKNTTK